jgi:hypothetical protein
MILLALVFNGCASKINLKPEIKKEIVSIQISTDLNISKLPFLMTKTDALSMGLGGAVGGAISGSNTTDEEKLAKLIKDNNIDIKNIYLDSLKISLQENLFFKNKIIKKNSRYILKSYIP